MAKKLSSAFAKKRTKRPVCRSGDTFPCGFSCKNQFYKAKSGQTKETQCKNVLKGQAKNFMSWQKIQAERLESINKKRGRVGLSAVKATDAMMIDPKAQSRAKVGATVAPTATAKVATKSTKAVAPKGKFEPVNPDALAEGDTVFFKIRKNSKQPTGGKLLSVDLAKGKAKIEYKQATTGKTATAIRPVGDLLTAQGKSAVKAETPVKAVDDVQSQQPKVERPQVAQPTKYKNGITVKTEFGTKKGDLYLLPGHEELNLIVVKPGGSKAKATKHGYEVYEQESGAKLDSDRYPNRDEPLSSIFQRVSHKIKQVGGNEPFMEKVRELVKDPDYVDRLERMNKSKSVDADRQQSPTKYQPSKATIESTGYNTFNSKGDRQFAIYFDDAPANINKAFLTASEIAKDYPEAIPMVKKAIAVEKARQAKLGKPDWELTNKNGKPTDLSALGGSGDRPAADGVKPRNGKNVLTAIANEAKSTDVKSIAPSDIAGIIGKTRFDLAVEKKLESMDEPAIRGLLGQVETLINDNGDRDKFNYSMAGIKRSVEAVLRGDAPVKSGDGDRQSSPSFDITKTTPIKFAQEVVREVALKQVDVHRDASKMVGVSPEQFTQLAKDFADVKTVAEFDQVARRSPLFFEEGGVYQARTWWNGVYADNLRMAANRGDKVSPVLLDKYKNVSAKTYGALADKGDRQSSPPKVEAKGSGDRQSKPDKPKGTNNVLSEQESKGARSNQQRNKGTFAPVGKSILSHFADGGYRKIINELGTIPRFAEEGAVREIEIGGKKYNAALWIKNNKPTATVVMPDGKGLELTIATQSGGDYKYKSIAQQKEVAVSDELRGKLGGKQPSTDAGKAGHTSTGYTKFRDLPSVTSGNSTEYPIKMGKNGFQRIIGEDSQNYYHISQGEFTQRSNPSVGVTVSSTPKDKMNERSKLFTPDTSVSVPSDRNNTSGDRVNGTFIKGGINPNTNSEGALIRLDSGKEEWRSYSSVDSPIDSSPSKAKFTLPSKEDVGDRPLFKESDVIEGEGIYLGQGENLVYQNGNAIKQPIDYRLFKVSSSTPEFKREFNVGFGNKEYYVIQQRGAGEKDWQILRGSGHVPIRVPSKNTPEDTNDILLGSSDVGAILMGKNMKVLNPIAKNAMDNHITKDTEYKEEQRIKDEEMAKEQAEKESLMTAWQDILKENAASLPSGKKGTIKIKTGTKEKGATGEKEVSVTTFGDNWAIGKALYGKGYSVTDRNSGLSMITVSSQSDAKKVLGTVIKDFGDVDVNTIQGEDRKRLGEMIRAFGEQTIPNYMMEDVRNRQSEKTKQVDQSYGQMNLFGGLDEIPVDTDREKRISEAVDKEVSKRFTKIKNFKVSPPKGSKTKATNDEIQAIIDGYKETGSGSSKGCDNLPSVRGIGLTPKTKSFLAEQIIQLGANDIATGQKTLDEDEPSMFTFRLPGGGEYKIYKTQNALSRFIDAVGLSPKGEETLDEALIRHAKSIQNFSEFRVTYPDRQLLKKAIAKANGTLSFSQPRRSMLAVDPRIAKIKRRMTEHKQRLTTRY